MILLDTNVMSELMKAVPDPAVERWFLLNEDQCWIASVAISELAYGVAKLDDGARKTNFDRQLAEWRVRYANRSLTFDMPAALAYGDLLAASRRAGRPMSIPDAQIAAVATDNGCALATRNGKDFAATSVKIINPWTD